MTRAIRPILIDKINRINDPIIVVNLNGDVTNELIDIRIITERMGIDIELTTHGTTREAAPKATAIANAREMLKSSMRSRKTV